MSYSSVLGVIKLSLKLLAKMFLLERRNTKKVNRGKHKVKLDYLMNVQETRSLEHIQSLEQSCSLGKAK